MMMERVASVFSSYFIAYHLSLPSFNYRLGGKV